MQPICAARDTAERSLLERGADGETLDCACGLARRQPSATIRNLYRGLAGVLKLKKAPARA